MKKILLIIILSLFLISNVYAAPKIGANDTLGTLKQSLKELEKKEKDNANKKQKTQSEINYNLKKKSNAENELVKTQEEISNVEEQIDHTNKEIEKLKKEAENLLILYQKLDNENIYASYVTGASSITELIMRIDAINELTVYNEKKLASLELLIKNNEKMNDKLDSYKNKLDRNIVAYEESVEELRDVLVELEEGEVTIQDEIKNMKQLIKNYEAMGCKDDQLLSVCINVSDNAGWLKPVSKGKITSLYGYRTSPIAGASSNHKGIDIGIPEGTAVYPTANGVVGAIVERSSCGGNMLYIWVTVNGKQYTTVFMHLKSFAPGIKVGSKVTVNTVVAYSGGGASTAAKYGGYDRCTTGAHLHYGLAYNGWYGSGKTTPLSSFNSHTMKPPGYPGLYQWFYSR